MTSDPADTSPRCPTCGYRLHGLPLKRCPECGNEFRSPERWWKAVLGADQSRPDREAMRGETALAILGVVLMIGGFVLWWLSPPYEKSSGLSAAFRFRADGGAVILTVAALELCREMKERIYPVLLVTGIGWLLYGGFYYFFG